MTSSPRVSLLRFALFAGAISVCAVSPAAADPGHSGAQPVDAGTAPVVPVWQRTGAGDGNVRTSVLISGGPVTAQRVIYGTADGVVHFRRVSDGSPVGGADVSNAPNAFGTPSAVPGDNRASASFADVGGRLYAAHNEAGGIEIAEFDEFGGGLISETPVPGTAGMTIESSLLATPSARYFVAGGRLFKVPASGAPTSTPDVNANPLANPTLINLAVLGTPTPHIAIGTTDGFLRTYRAADLAPGPSIDLSVPLGSESITASDVMTPSVPVQSDGGLPDDPQFVYVAAQANFSPFGPGNDDTVAYKLHVVDGALEFQFEFLPIPDTTPAPGLAVSQLSTPDTQDAEVLISTATNLFLATTRDMDLTGEIDFESDLAAGTDGFQQTTAATSGALYYVTNDRGEQFTGRLSDGKTVPAEDFTRDSADAGADNAGLGQPAISRGYVAFAGPDGVFVYRNADGTDPAVALTAPAADATVSGRVTVAATASDSRGVAQVEFLANGRSLGTATSATDDFALPVDTDAMPAGEYVLEAIATDTSGRTTLSAPRRVVIRSRGEDAPPTVAFTKPASGAHLKGRPTLAADAADDRGVASVRFLAGTRVVCTDTTAPYSCAYKLRAGDVGRTTLVAIATDTAGQTGTALRSVRVNRFAPRSVTAKTTRRGLRFTTTGRVRRPTGITSKQACGTGNVRVQIKSGRKTLSSHRVRLSRLCTYRARVTLRSRKPKLSVRVRFLGNAVLAPRSAKTITLR